MHSGSPTWTRTRDLRINSPSLYQLSYQGKEAALYVANLSISSLRSPSARSNKVNALARYEYKMVRDHSRADGEDYRAHIVSTHLDYHPSRSWWMTSRLAGKVNADRTVPAGEQKYSGGLSAGHKPVPVRWA